MKNELGIEIKCENCWHSSLNTWLATGNKCELHGEDGKIVINTKRCRFWITNDAYEARIKELQEQQLTEKELQFIKNRLDECIEEWDVPDMVFMAHQILKKIERI